MPVACWENVEDIVLNKILEWEVLKKRIKIEQQDAIIWGKINHQTEGYKLIKKKENNIRYAEVTKGSPFLFKPAKRAPDIGIIIPKGPYVEVTEKKFPAIKPIIIEKTP